jgi:hypothetical protein
MERPMTIQFLQFLFGLSLLLMAGGLAWPAVKGYRVSWPKWVVASFLFGWGVWAVWAGIIGALTGNVL